MILSRLVLRELRFERIGTPATTSTASSLCRITFTTFASTRKRIISEVKGETAGAVTEAAMDTGLERTRQEGNALELCRDGI